MQIRLLTLLIVPVLLLGSGCTSRPADPAEQILGTWQTSIGGLTYTTSYSASEVTVEGHPGVGYALAGDQLTIAGDTLMTRVVSFPDDNTMEQIDTITRARHIYTRVTE